MLEEGVSNHRHQRMTMKAVPRPSHEVVETVFLLQLLMVGVNLIRAHFPCARARRNRATRSEIRPTRSHTDPLWRSSLSIDARSVIATRWRRLLTTSPIPF